jgi:uncharacterized RDD family membrane protein YckC
MSLFQLSLRNLPIILYVLLVLSQTSGCDDIQGSQPSDSLNQPSEPLIFHDPFLRWIKYFPRSRTWHDFVPPSLPPPRARLYDFR